MHVLLTLCVCTVVTLCSVDCWAAFYRKYPGMFAAGDVALSECSDVHGVGWRHLGGEGSKASKTLLQEHDDQEDNLDLYVERFMSKDFAAVFSSAWKSVVVVYRSEPDKKFSFNLRPDGMRFGYTVCGCDVCKRLTGTLSAYNAVRQFALQGMAPDADRSHYGSVPFSSEGLEGFVAQVAMYLRSVVEENRHHKWRVQAQGLLTHQEEWCCGQRARVWKLVDTSSDFEPGRLRFVIGPTCLEGRFVDSPAQPVVQSLWFFLWRQVVDARRCRSQSRSQQA